MLSTTRHAEYFNPELWGDRQIDVIGAGATGSYVIMTLAKLGLRKIRAWDFDKIEAHNIANQNFGLPDIGKFKVEAIRDKVLTDTGIEIEAMNARVTGAEKLGHTVFLLTDSMESRREIWQKGLRLKLPVKQVIETRMAADQGRVYLINPSSPAHIRTFEQSLSEKVKVVESACGTRISIGATAQFTASLAVSLLIRAFRIEKGLEKGPVENEIFFGLNPMGLQAQSVK